MCKFKRLRITFHTLMFLTGGVDLVSMGGRLNMSVLLMSLTSKIRKVPHYVENHRVTSLSLFETRGFSCERSS